jgi:outer membrane protein assembly factor BamB
MRFPLLATALTLSAIALSACGDDGSSDEALRDAADFASGGSAPDMQIIDTTEEASAIAYGDGHLWIGNGLSGTIQRVTDTGTGAVSNPIETVGEGELITDLAVGQGQVWVPGDQEVFAVDSSGASAKRAVVTHPANGIAVAPEGVWIAGGGETTRLDPATAEAGDPVETPGAFSEDIAIAAGTVFLPSTMEGGQVQRLAADSGEQAGYGPLTVGVQPDAIGSHGDRVFIGDEKANSVHVVDAKTGAPVGAPIPVGDLPSDIEANEKGVFVLAGSQVVALDVNAGRVAWKAQLTRSMNDMAVTPDALWLVGGHSLIKMPL